MNQIDLNNALFKTLLDDYEKYKKEKKYQAQFQTGVDYFEAVIKFFGVLNISVVKELDENIYKKIISKNFKETPSLGDYKSLATHPFNDEYVESLKSSEFYNFLNQIFNTSTNLSGQLLAIKAFIEDIDEKATKSTQNISKLKNLFDNYLVTFRNKLKGHAASFKEEETDQVKNILDTIDKIIKTLKKVLNNTLKEIKFYEKDSIIYAEYKNEIIDLLPLMIYHDCNKYSCKEKHRVKIFFFNDKNKENIYFLDYGYNHFYNLKEDENLKEKLNKFFDKLKEYQKEMKVFSYINAVDRKNKLLENFVGRKKELKSIKNHIQNNNATFTYIIGKPGIGKSAFVSKLLDEIDEKEFNKFLHYAKSGNEGADKEQQLKNIYSRLYDLITESLNMKIEEKEDVTINHKFEKLFKIYEEKASKPLIITIDGLDEYEDWKYIISNIPITFSNKIHLIITSRDYNDMVKYIVGKVADYNSTVNVYTTQNSKNRNYYFELGKLSNEEVAELISIAIPKEIKESENYEEIINIVIKKSEALPLYLDYLIRKLKDENIELNEFKEWSEKLPEGIDEFYKTSFEKADESNALNILKVIYFSTQRVYISEIEDIFAELNLTKDDNFKKNFNQIEIFLEESDNFYGFYHQSVKDALEIYLEKNDELFVLDDKKIEELLYFNPQKLIYLNKRKKTFKLLEETIEFLKKDSDFKFYETDFFHLYYQYIHFKIYQEMLDFDDVKQKNYEKILDYTKIGENIKKLIKDFFERFDSKENKYLYEIRYAYNLAFLVEDYERILKYMDMYQNNIYDEFFDIAMNIDKVEYIQKFIELKDDWIKNIPEELKDFYVEIMAKKEKLPDEFVEVMKFLEDEYKVKLIDKIDTEINLKFGNNSKKTYSEFELSNYNNLEKYFIKFDDIVNPDLVKNSINLSVSLNFLDNHFKFNTLCDEKKFEILISIINNFNKNKLIKLFNKIYKKIKFINDYDLRIFLIWEFIKKIDYYSIDLLQDILEIIEYDEDDFLDYKSKIIFNIIIYLLINNKLEIVFDLKLIEKINDSELKYILLNILLEKINDVQYEKQICLIVNDMEGAFYKNRIQEKIIHKLNDKETLKYYLNLIKKSYFELKNVKHLNTLVSLLIKEQKFNYLLQTIEHIYNEYWRYVSLLEVVKKVDDKKILIKILELIEEDIFHNSRKSILLMYIGKKINNINLIQEAINIAKKEENYRLLVELGIQLNDKQLIEIALKIIEENHLYDFYVFQVLKDIILYIQDINFLNKLLITIKKLNSKKSEKNILIKFLTIKYNLLEGKNIQEIINVIQTVKDDDFVSESYKLIINFFLEKEKIIEIFNYKLLKNIKEVDKLKILLNIIQNYLYTEEIALNILKMIKNMNNNDIIKIILIIYLFRMNNEKKYLNLRKKNLLELLYQTLINLPNKCLQIAIIHIINKKILHNCVNDFKIFQSIFLQIYAIKNIWISETLYVIMKIPFTIKYIMQYFDIEIEEEIKTEENILYGIDKQIIDTIKTLIKLGNSNEEIAKIAKVDLKVVKYLREKGTK